MSSHLQKAAELARKFSRAEQLTEVYLRLEKKSSAACLKIPSGIELSAREFFHVKIHKILGKENASFSHSSSYGALNKQATLAQKKSLEKRISDCDDFINGVDQLAQAVEVKLVEKGLSNVESELKEDIEDYLRRFWFDDSEDEELEALRKSIQERLKTEKIDINQVDFSGFFSFLRDVFVARKIQYQQILILCDKLLSYTYFERDKRKQISRFIDRMYSYHSTSSDEEGESYLRITKQLNMNNLNPLKHEGKKEIIGVFGLHSGYPRMGFARA